MYNPLDPFGITAACGEVQKAWWTHPFPLSQELTRLNAGVLALATWQRAAGLPQHGDLIPPVVYDERFQHPLWTKNPVLDTLKEAYLLYTRWLEDSIYATPEVAEKTKRKAAFWTREFLNAVAPSNFLLTNPEAVMRALETGGRSLAQGWRNFLADLAAPKKPSKSG